MKTTFTLGISAMLMLAAGSASAVTLFSDDFTRANSNTIGNGWSELSDAANDVAIVGNRVRLRDNIGSTNPDAAIGSQVIDATGYENINVTYTWQSLNANEANDRLRLSYAFDPAPALTAQGQWTQVSQVSDAGTTVNSASLALGAVTDSTFSLMFWTVVNGNNNNNEGFYLDNIVVTGDLIPVPLPAGAPLLLLGLGGFAALRRRK